MNKPLLLNFRSETTPYGITRYELKELAKEMGMSETQTIHVALARMYFAVFQAEEELSDEELSAFSMDEPTDVIYSISLLDILRKKEHATKLFNGDELAAEHWLKTPNITLGGRKPKDCDVSEIVSLLKAPI